ncbi:hypothetical protein ACROYT_G039146 [Oculina patagonica]
MYGVAQRGSDIQLQSDQAEGKLVEHIYAIEDTGFVAQPNRIDHLRHVTAVGCFYSQNLIRCLENKEILPEGN